MKKLFLILLLGGCINKGPLPIVKCEYGQDPEGRYIYKSTDCPTEEEAYIEQIKETNPELDIKWGTMSDKAKDWNRIKALFSELDIIAYYAQYGELRKHMCFYVGPCAIHDGAGESFQVKPDQDLFLCHGCGAEGGILDYVILKEKTDKEGAIAILDEWITKRMDATKKKIKDERNDRFKRGNWWRLI